MTEVFGCPVVVSDRLRDDILFALVSGQSAAAVMKADGSVQLISHEELYDHPAKPQAPYFDTLAEYLNSTPSDKLPYPYGSLGAPSGYLAQSLLQGE